MSYILHFLFPTGTTYTKNGPRIFLCEPITVIHLFSFNNFFRAVTVSSMSSSAAPLRLSRRSFNSQRTAPGAVGMATVLPLKLAVYVVASSLIAASAVAAAREKPRGSA